MSKPAADTRWGLTRDQWEATRRQMRDIIVSRAVARETLTYGELASLVTTIDLKPYSYRMVALLEEICEREDAERGIMLASLVVRKPSRAGEEAMPGAGYFRKAAYLGRDTTDPAAFWHGERDRVFAAFAAGDPGEPSAEPAGRIAAGKRGERRPAR